MRTGVERGQWGPADGQDKEEWVQERIAYHYDPDGTIEFNLSDGRCIRVEEQKTPEGGIVGVRTDITVTLPNGASPSLDHLSHRMSA